MSPSEKKQIAERFIDEIFNKGNLQEVSRLVTRDFIYHARGEKVKQILDELSLELLRELMIAVILRTRFGKYAASEIIKAAFTAVLYALSEKAEHITRTAFLGSGEVARFSISKEGFLTLKAYISKVTIVRNCRPFSVPRFPG